MTDPFSDPDEAIEPPSRMDLFRDRMPPAEVRALYREIWRLAWPVFIGQGLNSVVGFATRIIVSELGEKAYNSVNIGMMVFFVIITVIAAVGVGTTALVAQNWGMGDRKRAGEVLQQSLIFGFLLCVIISAIGIALHKVLYEMMGTDPETAEAGERFLFWLFLAVPVLAPGFFMASALRGAGDTRTPMVVGVIMGALGLVLAFGLILGKLGMPRLETLGAALSVDISFLIFTLILTILFVTNRTILKLPLRGWRLDWKTGTSILKIGVPSATEWVLIQLGMLLYVVVITSYGEEALAGYFTGVSLLMLAQTPAFGLQTAATTIVGQSVGAGDFKRAEAAFRRVSFLGFVFMAAIGAVVLAVVTPEVLSFFFRELTPESIDYSRTYIILLIFVMPLMGVAFTIAGGLRGAGDTIWPLIGSAVGVYGGRILMAFAFFKLFHPPVWVIWCSMFPDLFLRIVVMSFRLWSGKWKKRKV